MGHVTRLSHMGDKGIVGGMGEDTRVRLHVRLPVELHHALKVRAVEERTTLEDLVEALLGVGLKHMGRKT